MHPELLLPSRLDLLREPLAVRSPALKQAVHQDHHISIRPLTVAIAPFGHHLAWSALDYARGPLCGCLGCIREGIVLLNQHCLDKNLCEPVTHCECSLNLILCVYTYTPAVRNFPWVWCMCGQLIAGQPQTGRCHTQMSQFLVGNKYCKQFLS